MNIFIFLILFGYTQLVTSSMLKCGEEIRVNRGEKKTLRFWSTDDELLRVEMVPNRGESDASALLAMFKNSYNKGSDIFGSRDEPLKFKSSLGSKNDDQESLYRIDEKIIENFNNFSSETKPPQYYADNETQTTSSPVSQKDEEIQTTISSVRQKDEETQTASSFVSQKEEEIQTTISSVRQKDEETQTTISSVRQKDEETQTASSSVSQKDEEIQTTISSVKQKDEETQTISSSVSQKDEETQTTIPSVSQKDEETQTISSSVSQKDEETQTTISSVSQKDEETQTTIPSVETKSEHKNDENANEIPDKEWDIKTSTQMSITPEEEMEHVQEQTSHVNKEDVPSNEFSATEEITTEGYQEDLQVLDFSYESEIEESEPSTENKIKANIQGQNHEEVSDVTNYYKFAEETTMTQDMDEGVTPLPEIDIRVNNDLTTIPVTEQTTSIYLHEISDSSTELPLEEKYDDNLRTEIPVESLFEPVANEDKDIMDTTESFEDKTASHMKEDPSTTIITEVESTTLSTSLDYKLKEESTETDPKTDSNDVTPSIETRTENLEIYSTEPVQDFTTESENIKVSSDDISSPEDTTELKIFENDHTESSITTDLTSESAAKEQFDEKITINEMENTPEIYIEEGDLEDIISELKSQEALLKLPSVGDNPQNSGTVSDSNDSESIDLKLSILKNIIKEITSEIEAKGKQKTEIDDSRNHIYLPYSEEETFAGNEEQNNERQSIEKVKSGKIHVVESSSISSLRKHLLEKASKADLSTANEIMLPNIFNSASSANQQKENSTQNTIEKVNSDLDIDLDIQLTTVSTVESETSKISNEDEKMEEREEQKNTQSESKNPNTNFPSHEELVIPLNLLKIFNENDTEKASENKPKELANSDLKSQASSLSNDQDSLNKENTLSFQETAFKSMRKEGINLKEKITTSSSTIEDETSTMEDNDEQVHVSNSDNSATFGKETGSDIFGKETGSPTFGKETGSDIFGKETGSDKVLSLIKKGEKGIIEFTKHEHEGENSILLPSQVLSPKRNPSQTLAAAENDNKVEIKEPGSKVVIIKPNSDILKAKKESDSLALNTENGNYEVEIESTTSQQFISEENPESVSETLDASNPNSENLITNKPVPEEEIEVTTLGQEMEKSTTESYIPFGLVKEKYNAETDEIQNESLINSKVDTVNAIPHEAEASDRKPADVDNISDNENPSPYSDTFSADLLKSDTNENSETEIFDALVNEDDESQSYYNDETFDYDAAYPQKEHLQRKIDTDIHEEKSPQNYLYNHRIEENPLPYVLQTRKGLVEVDPTVGTPIRTGSIQNRKDDSQQTFGKDSPFYIKLPGTQDMVPVFLQYEPVKVKYVNAEKFFKKKPGNAIDKTQTIEKVSNDVSSSSPKKILKTKSKDKYSPEVDVSKIPDYLNVDFHLRPDPFYVMDPPNLANKVNKNVEEETNEVETMSLNVEGKLSFNKQQNTPNAMKEDKPVYPGEYFIKNPDNSYSSSDTSSLTNPVFSLGSKVTLPPRESVNLQYTPFPLTTNPPKKQTPEDTENEIEVASISPLPLYSPTAKTTTFITSDASSNSTENTPSIEYSPIPSIDYPDSYGPFEFPDIPFVENNEDLLFDNTPDSLSDTYPEKATFITGIKNEKLIDEPLKKNNDFDIVALANFLHQNQKVWSTPKATPNPETNSWRNPSWDDVIRSAEEPEKPRSDTNRNSGPWVERRRERGEERFYSAFRSPEEVPGLDPAFFSYRKMPTDIKEKESLKDSNLSVEKRSSSNVDGIMRYIENLPLIMQKAVMNPKSNTFGRRAKRSSAPAGEHVYCEWNIKTEPGLYLLVTFHNLSAPYTVDCYGAYIEVERENNGYDARWCGNRATVPGARPHVIFAKSEVRITLYDNGDAAKTYPTGFEAEIEVIDLFDTEEYKHFIEKKATPKIRRLMEG
ncbi:UNVERIFIED_CONTAM: hypothetical protein RMT77_010464 [Armadillidium vulgare]